jgi:hypothetical protein
VEHWDGKDGPLSPMRDRVAVVQSGQKKSFIGRSFSLCLVSKKSFSIKTTLFHTGVFFRIVDK